MKLHANAALTLSQRRRMVRLVVDEKWSISAAAAAVQDLCQDLFEVGGPLPGGIRGGPVGSQFGPSLSANRTDERRIEAIAALRRLRFTGPEIAELLDMPLSTVSGILTRIGLGRLGRLGLEPAQRYERARPGELIHIDVKKLGRIVGGAGHRVTGARAGTSRRQLHRPGRPAAQQDRLGVRARRDRRRHPPGLRRGARPTRRPAPRSGSCAARCVLRRLRHHRRARDDRQRLAPTARPCTPSPAARSASATCAPGPTGRRPTARPSDSSAPCSAAGPTARSTASAENAPQPLTAGCSPTTIAADTQASGDKHPSPA